MRDGPFTLAVNVPSPVALTVISFFVFDPTGRFVPVRKETPMRSLRYSVTVLWLVGLAPAAGLAQHLPRLADAGGAAQEHLKPAPALRRGGGQQGVGVGPAGVGHRTHP